MDLELWKKRKKELHLNNEELAKLAGVSKRTIEDVFRGFTATPRIDTVEAIERALGLSNDITPEDRATGWTETKKVSLTPEDDEWLTYRKEILRLYGQPGIDAISKMIESYLSAKK